ncbi:MAG: hypothetical protein ACU836_11290 [Gammaproteobacteria bacterium]
MKILSLLFVLAFGQAYAETLPTIVFSDNFDDGNLNGWTIKSGDWSNLGDQLLSSYHNYGIIRKNDSFGYNQSVLVDAYFDSGIPDSKTAQIFIRNGNAGRGPNPFWDHGYFVNVLDDVATIFNAVEPYNQQMIGQTELALTPNSWHTIEFSVDGFGNQTNLQLKIDGVPYLNVFDTFGSQHDDGGYLALGSSNHLNRRITYDNFVGTTDTGMVPLPASNSIFVLGLLWLLGSVRGLRVKRITIA